MSDNNKCVYVSSMLPSPSPPSSDFTRSLQVKLNNLNFEEKSVWIQRITSSPPQSPSNSTYNNHPEEGLKIRINGRNPTQDVENLGSSSSADEFYETASDNSNKDDEEVEVNDSYEGSVTPKIRRCSSLKTGKTPPGTPGSKKIVRFADALGLDLADVKTFIDEIPKIPISAYHDLQTCDDGINCEKNFVKNSGKTLVPLFYQPVAQNDFLDVIREHYVSLENAVVEDQASFLIKGVVRVRNIDFHKSVFVRYSIDKWITHVDIKANYVENSCDGFSDKFTFLVYANMLNVGDSLELAVLFQARGEQFWDNNKGVNYRFECISIEIPSSSNVKNVGPSLWDEQWGAAFY